MARKKRRKTRRSLVWPPTDMPIMASRGVRRLACRHAGSRVIFSKLQLLGAELPDSIYQSSTSFGFTLPPESNRSFCAHRNPTKPQKFRQRGARSVDHPIPVVVLSLLPIGVSEGFSKHLPSTRTRDQFKSKSKPIQTTN